MHTIIVHMAEPQWTAAAMHLACATALQSKAQVVLLWLIPVSNPSWLGAEPGQAIATAQTIERKAVYMAIARDYPVDCTIQLMEYFTLDDALIEAADLWKAQIVFAQLPKSIIPYWDKMRLWNLKRRLAVNGRQLDTLNEPTEFTHWGAVRGEEYDVNKC